MSNIFNEELLFRLWEEAFDELIANGMDWDEAEVTATDVAIKQYEEIE